MSDNNFMPTGRFCFRMGRYYDCTNDDKIDSVYSDIHQLLERDLRNQGDYAKTMNDLLVKFNHFLKETQQQQHPLACNVISKMQKAYADVVSYENGVTLARREILGCLEDIIVLSGGIGRGDDNISPLDLYL